MWKWMRNGKVMSALGFLVLIVLIWFVGPLAGLKSMELRFAWIFGVMLLWVATLMIGRAVADRAGGVLERFLRRQADDAVMDASPERRAEVARLRQNMLSAIDTLKNSRIGKARGKAALYELPWYMIIGHPAAGKSSAIQHSGLTFPFGDKQVVQGIGGTRDCDWFFSTEGVLLDTAGRYATQREDRGEWLEFLKLLKKHRPKAPANGILVAISFPELVQFRSEQFALYARQVRERINEIDNAFGVKVPIYLVFTKIDLLGGFAQFFEDMTEDERRQVWGATLSHDQGAAFDARSAVGQQFDALHRGLVQIGTDKLANQRDGIRRPALFAFPIEFNAMREAVCKFVELLFQDDPYHAKPLLRGFYFTSALQEGTPRIAAGARVSSRFDLSRSGFDAAQLPASNGFFLHNLFREVLFPDQHLVTRQVRPGSSRLRAVAIAVGVLLMSGLAGGLTWSYVGNQKLIASACEELLSARKLAESGSLADRLKALQVLQLRLEQLYSYRKEGHPFRLGWSLYRGAEVEQAMRAEYFGGVKALMLAPVTAELERSLGGLNAAMAGIAPAGIPDSAAAAPVAKPAPADEPVPPKALPQKKRRSARGLPVIPISFGIPVDETAVGARPAVYRAGGAPRVVLIASPVASNTRNSLQAASKPAKEAVGGAAGPGNASANPMEDGYNALKTYLMLRHKEYMDVAHLSDQIPKYWRAWLDANKGDARPEEITRLAERVVSFYVSQIGETDLPLIDNREDLIASSRDVLRGAMHRLSARERVYNELKARANTQFAPMTVGHILNGGDLTIVAGSYAVPGAFTREAWDKYFRNAIADASKGEVKGDDWVLATTTRDNLGKDGDAERNRKELEALYKADYVREWTKFLQGVAIRDFASLDHAAQSLGKLADPQNSAVRLIFAKVAYETAWDNPSTFSSSIESAKNSVIERTEKLILGSDGNKPAGQSGLPYGEVGAKFAVLSTMTAESQGGKPPIAAYLDALAKLKGKVAQAAANDSDGAARQLMQTTLNGNGSELADALAIVDGVLLANVAEDAREAVRPLLVRPLMQTYAALIPSVERELNAAWQADVLSQWHTLSSKYPFADGSNEASMADIAKFLKPHEGTLPKFIEKNLSGLVTRRGDALVPRTWANLGVSFNAAFLGGAARLMAVGGSVLQEGEGAKFEMQPIPTPGLSEILMEIDGQLLRYRNGPQAWTSFTWPNAAGNAAQGARIQAMSFSGASTSVANFGGRLGLMRLLSQARADSPSAPTVQLEWRFKSGRPAPEKVAAGDRQAAAESDGDVVRFNFRMVSGSNPLALSGLRRLGLPEKITNQE